MILKIIYFFFFLNVCRGAPTNEGDLDSIIESLVNGDDIPVGDVGEQPIFRDGLWRCGSCDNVDEGHLIYEEMTAVGSNVPKTNEVQVGLAVDDMKCVTVDVNAETTVRLVSGSCTGDQATLSVAANDYFNVQVFS